TRAPRAARACVLALPIAPSPTMATSNCVIQVLMGVPRDNRVIIAAAALSLLHCFAQPSGALDLSGAYDSDEPSHAAEASMGDDAYLLSHGTQDASTRRRKTATLRRGVQRTRRRIQLCAFVPSPPARWASPRRLRLQPARWPRSRTLPNFVGRHLIGVFRSRRSRRVKSSR